MCLLFNVQLVYANRASYTGSLVPGKVGRRIFVDNFGGTAELFRTAHLANQIASLYPNKYNFLIQRISTSNRPLHFFCRYVVLIEQISCLLSFKPCPYWEYIFPLTRVVRQPVGCSVCLSWIPKRPDSCTSMLLSVHLFWSWIVDNRYLTFPLCRTWWGYRKLGRCACSRTRQTQYTPTNNTNVCTLWWNITT